MRYDVSKEIAEIAKLTYKTEEAVANNLHIEKICGEWWAGNRSEQNRVYSTLADAKNKVREEKEAAELNAKLEAGTAIWRKISGEWLVQVTGREVKVDDIITVERKDGSKSDVVVKSVVTSNENGIFVRV